MQLLLSEKRKRKEQEGLEARKIWRQALWILQPYGPSAPQQHVGCCVIFDKYGRQRVLTLF